MKVKGLGGETAGMKSLELKHLELNSHVAKVVKGCVRHPVIFHFKNTAVGSNCEKNEDFYLTEKNIS